MISSLLPFKSILVPLGDKEDEKINNFFATQKSQNEIREAIINIKSPEEFIKFSIDFYKVIFLISG